MQARRSHTRNTHMSPLSADLQLCKHDWVGDDACQYCRVDELKAAAIDACSEMGCFCDEDIEDDECPMCKLEKVLHD
jgi:hypothetical protein